MGYNTLPLVFIFVLKLSQIWPMKAPSQWFLVLQMDPDHFLSTSFLCGTPDIPGSSSTSPA